jgi:VanZ family protein
MPMHKTSAWPLAWVYLGLIIYASLYPFADWRYQGVVPWGFLSAPLPRYWTGFDVVSNVLGYMPLGFFLVLTALRTGRQKGAIFVSVLVSATLSLLMESLQSFLPDRVSSNLDLFLNAVGAFLGTLMAWSLERMGWLQRWNRFRASWFLDDARGAMVLLALWPVALLFPTEIPLGLGQVVERWESAVQTVLDGSIVTRWVPLGQLTLQPMSAFGEWCCVVLGLLIPGLLGYCVVPRPAKRIWLLGWVLLLGIVATGLSAALSFGPQHAWEWLVPSTRLALGIATLFLALLIWVPTRAAAALALLVLGVDLSLVNQDSVSPYFEQTLFLWEQGRFIRFHGVVQWLGWLWPFAALGYVLSLLWARETKN